jgi:2-oxoacid:acceptor oxidoreductase gamma subunit (pyruvate/2-ketoisovalerate family)
MLEIRLHGRGGQGAVTAAELIAEANVVEGRYGQSFPLFGPERRGAPVMAFARLDDKPISIRGIIKNPDIVMVLDESLLHVVDVTSGLKLNGLAIVAGRDSNRIREKLNVKKIAVLDAQKIALEIVGTPITNTAIIGAFVKATKAVKLETVEKLVLKKFIGKIGEKNVEIIERAYKETVVI